MPLLAPKVTVLLPCYNSAATLREAVSSVLRQTFADFELLILDDGSTEELPTFKDPRVEVLRSDRNLGLSRQLNLGLERARGKYIARLDADDIAKRRRFAQQVALLDSKPDIGICGSQAQLFDARGHREIWDYPTRPETVHATLFLRSSFLHPGVMFRRKIIRDHALCYDPNLEVAQDYDLWYRFLQVTKGTNLPQCLTHYRVSSTQLTQAHCVTKERETEQIRRRMLRDLDHEHNLPLYHSVLAARWEESPAFYKEVATWLNSIHKANIRKQIFPVDGLANILAEMFFHRCQCATRRELDGLQYYRMLSFSDAYTPGRVDVLRSRVKSVLKPPLSLAS